MFTTTTTVGARTGFSIRPGGRGYTFHFFLQHKLIFAPAFDAHATTDRARCLIEMTMEAFSLCIHALYHHDSSSIAYIAPRQGVYATTSEVVGRGGFRSRTLCKRLFNFGEEVISPHSPEKERETLLQWAEGVS